MIKANEIADPSSCLNRAAEDEPIFVLRAHDELAAGVVRHWANLYASSKAAAYRDLDSLTEEQRQKYRHALALADAMDRYHAALARRGA